VDLAAARAELGDRGFDYLSAPRMDIMLNNARNQLEDEYPWPWLETTTTGSAPLTISDLKSVLYVVDQDADQILAGVDARDVVDRDAGVATAGTADSWWLDGTTTLRTYPVSSASLLVRYVRFSPQLTAGSDTPLIPERYHPVWIDLAVIQAYKDSDNYQAAAALQSDVNARVGRMMEIYAARNRQNQSLQVLTFASEDW